MGPKGLLATRLILVIAFSAQAAHSQTTIENPVYLDDSTAAAAALDRIDELVARGAGAETARALQQVLDEERDRVLESAAGAGVFVPVRGLVHRALLARPELLQRYRDAEEAAARSMIDSGHHREAEASRLLTPSGFEAALRVAQEHIEGAHFGAARRSLEQLETHPDRVGDGAAAAARLAIELARFSQDPRAADLARRWGLASGLAGAGEIERVHPPGAARQPVVNAADPASGFTGLPLSLASVLTDPLESVAMTAGDAEDSSTPAGGLLPAAWTLPVTEGDRLYLNDGETLSAWDRFTLRPLWRVRTLDEPGAPSEDRSIRARRDRLGRSLEDPTTLRVHEGMVIASTGRAVAGGRRGDPRVHAFDAETGTRIWSLDPEAVDTSLAGASLRGSVIISDGVVVVALRKNLRTRRLVGLSLLGIDLHSGEALWVRPVASTGSLPFQQFSPLPVGLAQDDGLVFVTDVLGVAGAVEAVSGRVRWVRRLPADPFLVNRPRAVWSSSDPVPQGRSLILHTPDQRSVLRIEADRGIVLGSRPASDFGEPLYLTVLGGMLAAVGERSVAFVPASEMETGDVVTSETVPEPGLRGRVIGAGKLMAMPVMDGVIFIDPESPRAQRQTLELERTGNLLVLPGQVLVADEALAHSFLSWSEASRLLERRITENPADPGPALTLLELAFGARRFDRLVGASDGAIEAIGRLGPGEREEASDRLFDALASMTQTGPDEDRWAAALSNRAAGVSRIDDADVIASLIERMARVARTPGQRVTHAMADGALADRMDRASRALESYQSVLLDPALSGASWRGGGLVVRADLEATRRIGRLVRDRGVGVYAGFEAVAQAEGASVIDDPDALAALARRFPAASGAAALWLRAGAIRAGNDEPLGATAAWRSGVMAAELLHDAGGTVDAAVLAELVGRLASALGESGRAGEAGEWIRRSRARFGSGLEPTVGGSPLAETAFFTSAVRQGASASRASVGRAFGTRVSLLPGIPLEPVERGRGTPTNERVLISGARAEVMLARRDAGGRVSVVWSRAIGSAAPLLLRHDKRSVVLLSPRTTGRRGGVIESLDTETGQVLWRTEPFDDAAVGPPPERGARVQMGSGQALSGDDMIVSVSGRTGALLDRSGRAVVFDLETGRQLWARELGVGSVVDALVTGGMLVVAGEVNDAGPLGRAPGLVAVDARSGAEVRRIDRLASRVSWLREGVGSSVIVGLGNSVISLDLDAGRPEWVSNEAPARSTQDAWIAGDRLLVVGPDFALWLFDLSTGRVRAEPLDHLGRIAGQDEVVVVREPDRIVAGTDRGLVVFDLSGRLLGADPFEGRQRLLISPAGGGITAALEIDEQGDDGARHTLHLLETSSGRLLSSQTVSLPPEIRLRASALATMDGAVLVGFGSATLVVETEGR